MLYKPNSKETKQIKELNKGYNLMKKGFDIVMKHAPKNDGDISVYAYRASKNITKIIKKVAVLLEAEYVSKEFFSIVDSMKVKKKANRIKKKKKKDK